MVGPNLPFGGLACGLVLGPLPSPCMQFPLETLTLVGLWASKGYSHVSRLYALYTPRAWIPRDLGISLI